MDEFFALNRLVETAFSLAGLSKINFLSNKNSLSFVYCMTESL